MAITLALYTSSSEDTSNSICHYVVLRKIELIRISKCTVGDLYIQAKILGVYRLYMQNNYDAKLLKQPSGMPV